MKKKDLMKCPKCKKRLIPDRKAVIVGTKKWDGHTYRVDCNCGYVKKGMRISIG